MRDMLRAFTVVFAFVCLCGTVRQAAAQQLVACGWDEVFVIDAGEPTRKVWSWKAADRPELPEAYRGLFRTTDECKPVSQGRVLITASSDGAALVDVASGRALWWGRCGNTHSAELLPNDRIVLACSVRPETGNRLAVFDAGVPERALFSTELVSGHGVVWDEARQILWALGLSELRAYTLVDWETSTPSLALKATYPLPDHSGHELIAEPGTSRLVVSAHESVWAFDRDAGTFAPHPDLAGRPDVKGISIHPETGRIAFVQADTPEWWSRRVRFLKPEGEVTLPDERLYKVRWAGVRSPF